MFAAAVADVRAENALVTYVVVGVVAVTALSWYATSDHRWPVRAIRSATAAGVGVVVVTMENTF
jgi:hypothetical protein